MVLFVGWFNKGVNIKKQKKHKLCQCKDNRTSLYPQFEAPGCPAGT